MIKVKDFVHVCIIIIREKKKNEVPLLVPGYLMLISAVRGAFDCGDKWDDVCPGAPAANCDVYAPALAPEADLLALRAQLVQTLFNSSLPTTVAPDYILPYNASDTATSRGCWCSTLGNCDATACTWGNNKSGTRPSGFQSTK